MRRVVLLALIVLAAASCDDSPTSPSDPNVKRFTAILLPSMEVPPVTNADVSASGTMQLTMTVTRDGANNINGATYDFTVHVTGFPANTTLTGAHIHNGVAGVNAPVVVGLPLAGAETSLATGQATITKTGVTASVPANAAAVAQQIFNNPGSNYFNVHTTVNMGGAVRGQLVAMD
jgi:hypothetical protein